MNPAAKGLGPDKGHGSAWRGLVKTSESFLWSLSRGTGARTVKEADQSIVGLTMPLTHAGITQRVDDLSKNWLGFSKLAKEAKSIKKQMADVGIDLYPTRGNKFLHNDMTDDQIKERNESVLRTLPEFGLDFYEFTNPKTGKTRSSDSFGASSGRTIFNFSDANNINELKDLINAPLSGAFIEANPEYVKKYTKTIGNDVFLDKDIDIELNRMEGHIEVLKQIFN